MTSGEHGSSGPTVRRMMLGAQLRRLRECQEITRAQAGYQIRASESKISRLELGRVSFKVRDIEDLLTFYGIHDETERRTFLGMVEQSNTPGWWHRYSEVIPNWFNDYVGLEESASRIQSYELQLVPGLLQTEAYSRAVSCGGRDWAITEESERRVKLRMRRQKILARPEAPKLWAVLDESVLHRPIGGREVMRAQLDRLIEYVDMPHISLQVLPFEVSGIAAETTFTLLRFPQPELPNIVYIEHLRNALYLDRLDEIEVYSRIFDQLMVDAQTPQQTRDSLLKARSQF
jgi:transcriptional regulator with XRE-family HTH domain